MSATDHLNHKPDEAAIEKIKLIRKAIIELEELFENNVTHGRELSIAKTKLEEARMWAIKGVVLHFPTDPV